MKPTPKPRAVRPMKLFMGKSEVFEDCYISGKKSVGGDRPVLVIDLSPESVEALEEKAVKAVLDEYARPGSTIQEVAARVVSAIGIKPARVAKRNIAEFFQLLRAPEPVDDKAMAAGLAFAKYLENFPAATRSDLEKYLLAVAAGLRAAQLEVEGFKNNNRFHRGHSYGYAEAKGKYQSDLEAAQQEVAELRKELEWLEENAPLALWSGKWSELTDRPGQPIFSISKMDDDGQEVGDEIALGKDIRSAVGLAMKARAAGEWKGAT